MCVGGCFVTAALADEFRLGDAILRGCMFAPFAAVGSVPGVDLDPGAPSIFRFGAQYRDELAPASVTNASVQPGLRPGAVGEVARRSMFEVLRSSTTSRS